MVGIILLAPEAARLVAAASEMRSFTEYTTYRRGVKFLEHSEFQGLGDHDFKNSSECSALGDHHIRKQ